MATITGTLKAGYQLYMDIANGDTDTVFSYTVTGSTVKNGSSGWKSDRVAGPYQEDVNYSVTYTGSLNVYKVDQLGRQEYTAATLPDTASLPAGAEVVVDGRPVASDGRRLYPTNLSKVALCVIGQSTERSSTYRELLYTTTALSGDGTTASATTSIANNLPIGAVFKGKVTGAVPAGYNTSGFVDMTVTGTWPNGVITYASTGTGAQSTAGTVVISQILTFPELYASKHNAREMVPIYPSLSPDGSYWMPVKDALRDIGYDVDVTNAAIGSMSMAKEAAGQIAAWGATTAYRVARAPSAGGDEGCLGSLIIPGGTNLLMECTAGGDSIYCARSSGQPIRNGNASIYDLDYVYTVPSGSVTGASAPNWASITAKGQTLVDGGITWTCRSVNTTNDLDSSIKGTNTTNTILTEGRYGFDPMGIIRRAFKAAEAKALGYPEKVLYLQNGQSDTSTSATRYTDALVSVGSYFAARGWKVVVGFTVFNPNSNTTVYNGLSTARDNAITALQAAYPSMVFAGPNLYQLLGSTHGSNGLFLQSDNAHVAENVHLQGSTALLCAGHIVDSLLVAIG